MKKNTSFVFTGDIGFDKYMDKRWDAKSLCDEKVLGFLRSGDHLVVNVEAPITEAKKVIKPNGVAGLTHTMSPEAMGFFEGIGADIFNLCNNHIMDAGPEGLEDTLNRAKKENVLTLGAGMNLEEASKPLFFEEAGGIGILSVGYERACRIAGEDTPGCLNFSRMDIVRKRIEEIKKSCRWCVVVAHDGEEFTSLPSPYVRERFLSYLEMGADVVVAHHPHVPMNYETVGEKVIFYSLGNFVFDTDYQRSQYNTEKGLLLKISFSEEKFEFEPFGLLIDRKEEKIIKGELPKIFSDVNATEYEKLSALAAKQFISATRRQLKYMNPQKFSNATEEEFKENFFEPLRSGRVPGKLLDFQIVYPLSLEADAGKWKESSLKEVVEYIEEQIDKEP